MIPWYLSFQKEVRFIESLDKTNVVMELLRKLNGNNANERHKECHKEICRDLSLKGSPVGLWMKKYIRYGRGTGILNKKTS